ncbi:MAG: ISAs1 family transposase [Thiobacillaceae bacterium]
MSQAVVTSIQQHCGGLKDPRIDRCKRHQLLDILAIAICAVICSTDDGTEVEAFGKAKLAWFKTFLDLPNGIPSHDTFGRVFARLDPIPFEACFLRWIRALAELLPAEVVAVDGKELRRSADRVAGKAAICLVSAWASSQHVVLGQIKVDEKSNEITAIPNLLDALSLEGTVVTIDAAGCQTAIARKVIEKGGDYVLALKDNQPNLAADVALLFQDLHQSHGGVLPRNRAQRIEKGHGRIETRTCTTIADPALVAPLRRSEEWAGLASLIEIKAQRRIGGEMTMRVRYYLSSLDGDAAEALRVTRTHWSIENSLNWVLDVAFREDDSRVRTDHGPENLGILRRIAISLLKQESTLKVGVKAKRKAAGWDETYLRRVLAPLLP